MLSTIEITDKKGIVEKIREQAFKETQAKQVASAKIELKNLYAEGTIIQKSFGETVAEIMRTQGIVKERGKKEIIDTKRAQELTGLRENIFRQTMYKTDCTIEMWLVISMCIGFKLGPVLTQRLLQSAGLDFRFDNPNHLAYLFLLEYCQDMDYAKCNQVLKYLGVPKHQWLGSHGRGKDGEEADYKPRKPKK